MTEVTMNDLTYIGSAELQWEPWSFYEVAGWRGPDGLYIATDSGCSCPTPFDWLKSPDQLTGPLTADQAVEEITSLGIVASNAGDRALAEEAVAKLIAAIRKPTEEESA